MTASSPVSIVAGVVYLILFIYYLRMEAFSLILIFRKGILNVLNLASHQSKNGKKGSIGLINGLKRLYETSLFFNHSLAILSMILLIGSVAYLPVNQKLKLELLTVITSTVPYIWSYFRATNVGINGGIIGSLLGLTVFSLRIGSLDQVMLYTPYFLLFTFLANMSGWLGGWVGSGRTKEASYAIVAEIKVGNEGYNIHQLTEMFRKAIQSHLKSKYQNQIRFMDKKPFLKVLECETNCAVISYRHEMEWHLVEKPQKTAIGWLFKKEIPSTNKIIDYMFNLLRSQVTKVIFLSKTNPHDPSAEIGNSSLIHVLILNYKETPSIVWVDDEVKVLSDSIEGAIKCLFIGKAGEENQANGFSLIDNTQFVIRNWREKITLEQYSKDTHGSHYAYDEIKESQMGNTQSIPAYLMTEINETPTFFDNLRGSFLAFVLFLSAQVIVAISINIASDALSSGLW